MATDWEDANANLGGTSSSSVTNRVAASRPDDLHLQLAHPLWRAVKIPASAPEWSLKAHARLAAVLFQMWPRVEPSEQERRQKARSERDFLRWRKLKRAHETVMGVYGTGKQYSDRLFFLCARVRDQRERQAERRGEDLDEWALAQELTSTTSEQQHLLKMTPQDFEDAAAYCQRKSFSEIIEEGLRLDDDDRQEWKKRLASPGAVTLDGIIDHISEPTFRPPGWE